MSGRFWLISILTLMVVVLVGLRVILPKLTGKKPAEEWRQMRVGKAELEVLVADEPDEMELGLGGREALEENQGMLFVYPQAVIPRYWMKGMRFDLDFIWINGKQVVEITKNVPRVTQAGETMPFYTPKTAVDKVLEVGAGWVEAKGIKVGEEVRLPE